MQVDRLKILAAVAICFVLTACAGKPRSTAYLNVADLKTNLDKRLTRALADSDREKPQIRINRTVPVEIPVGGKDMHLFAVNISFIDNDEDQAMREKTLLVDPAGKLEISEMSIIASGENPARTALNLAAKKDIPPETGDLYFQGNGTAEVLVVSDPFCPYCRLSLDYLQDKKENIDSLRILQFPFDSHPGARASVLGLFASAADPEVTFSQALRFAYGPLKAPETKDESEANRFVLRQFKEKFSEALPEPGKRQKLEDMYGEKVDSQIREAENLGVSATPTIFINGIPVRGFDRQEIDRLFRE
ncbi:MAG: thioredoxin domain-containing protein [Desulfonatronovibrionaceae bacterium]